jgi:hypothetical protein
MTVCNFLTFEKIARLIAAASPTEQAKPVVPASIQADQQESSDEPEEDSDQAEFETDEPPTTKIVAEKAPSPLQQHKRRHIEDEREPETVQMEGLAESKTQRRGPKTGGAETQQLRKRQKGEDSLYYTSGATNNIYCRNRV